MNPRSDLCSAVRSIPRTSVSELQLVSMLNEHAILETTPRYGLVQDVAHPICIAGGNKFWQRVAQRSYDVSAAA